MKKRYVGAMIMILILGIPGNGHCLDAMRIRIRTQLPQEVATVGQAAQYFAGPIGYRLLLNSLDSARIAAEPIDPLARVSDVKPIEEAILMLLRKENYLLVIDKAHKLFSFQIRGTVDAHAPLRTRPSVPPRKSTPISSFPSSDTGVAQETPRLQTSKADPGDPPLEAGRSLASEEIRAQAKETAPKGHPLSAPTTFIPFADDSDTEFQEEALSKFIATTPVESAVLIIGHSHGVSAVGVADLATRRADLIRSYLEEDGYQDVQTMASWGDVVAAPNSGVSLYVLGGPK